MDTDSFVSSMKTEDSLNDLQNLNDLIVFTNLDRNHDLFSNKNN